jgi:DNA-directed RNA polymerase subunit RPC12/RpoP
MSLKVIEREYKCANCGATDHWKEVEGEINPPVLNCWKCHAGQGLDVGNQLQRKEGMFPTYTPEPRPQQAQRAH